MAFRFESFRIAIDSGTATEKRYTLCEKLRDFYMNEVGFELVETYNGKNTENVNWYKLQHPYFTDIKLIIHNMADSYYDTYQQWYWHYSLRDLEKFEEKGTIDSGGRYPKVSVEFFYEQDYIITGEEYQFDEYSHYFPIGTTVTQQLTRNYYTYDTTDSAYNLYITYAISGKVFAFDTSTSSIPTTVRTPILFPGNVGGRETSALNINDTLYFRLDQQAKEMYEGLCLPSSEAQTTNISNNMISVGIVGQYRANQLMSIANEDKLEVVTVPVTIIQEGVLFKEPIEFHTVFREGSPTNIPSDITTTVKVGEIVNINGTYYYYINSSYGAQMCAFED